MNQKKSLAYQMTTLFCIKRLFYALTTVFLHEFVVPQMYTYSFIPLFSIGFIYRHKPMRTKLLDFKESINELFILVCIYFIPMFTQWICDPKLRYQIGKLYVNILIFMAVLNFALIFNEMRIQIQREYRKR